MLDHVKGHAPTALLPCKALQYKMLPEELLFSAVDLQLRWYRHRHHQNTPGRRAPAREPASQESGQPGLRAAHGTQIVGHFDCIWPHYASSATTPLLWW